MQLSVLSIGSRRSLLSEFQAVRLATANARRPYELRLSRHIEVMTPGRMKMSSTGHIRDWNAVVCQVPGSHVMRPVMHHRHELELHLFWHIKPIMKVDRSTCISCLRPWSISYMTNKTCNCQWLLKCGKSCKSYWERNGNFILRTNAKKLAFEVRTWS